LVDRHSRVQSTRRERFESWTRQRLSGGGVRLAPSSFFSSDQLVRRSTYRRGQWQAITLLSPHFGRAVYKNVAELSCRKPAGKRPLKNVVIVRTYGTRSLLKLARSGTRSSTEFFNPLLTGSRFLRHVGTADLPVLSSRAYWGTNALPSNPEEPVTSAGVFSGVGGEETSVLGTMPRNSRIRSRNCRIH